MRFQSSRNPSENGAVVITEDGCLQIEPSEEFLTAMARQEAQAVHHSRLAGKLAALFFFGMGALIVILAWAMGRIGGEIRHNLMRPRTVRDVEIDASDSGGIRVIMPGEGPQRIALEWERGEIDPAEADRLVAVYNRFREVPPPE